MTDRLSANHDIILFDNAGVGGSTGKVPTTMAGMAEHAAAFLDSLGIKTCDVLGFSLGGVIAQQKATPALSERCRQRRKLKSESNNPCFRIRRPVP